MRERNLLSRHDGYAEEAKPITTRGLVSTNINEEGALSMKEGSRDATPYSDWQSLRIATNSPQRLICLEILAVQ